VSRPLVFSEVARQTPTLGAGLERERSIWARLHIDVPLLFALSVVLGFGMLVLYSAVDGSPVELRRQATFIGLGFVVMLTMAQLEVRLLRKLAPWMFLGGTALLVLVLLIGDVAKGARTVAFPALRDHEDGGAHHRFHLAGRSCTAATFSSPDGGIHHPRRARRADAAAA
jgi:hypothetical protein